MAQGWRVLDATSFSGIVGAQRGALTLTQRGSSSPTHTVPAAEVAVLVIGVGTAVTAAALHRLAQNDIALLSADWRGVPLAGLYPWSDHGRVAARHIAQAAMSLPRKKSAWQQLVRAKIAGQAATLRPVDPGTADRLLSLCKQVRSGDPTNVEGTAARLYWSKLFVSHDQPFRRLPEVPDNVNGQLNYGYTVLRGYGVRAVLGAGLCPPLGLFHHRRDNYFNLVDDLMEPFRPAVDAAVVALGIDADIDDPGTKKKLVAAATQVFASDGRKIPTVLADLAQQLGRYMEGEVDRFVVPQWSGVTTASARVAEEPDDEFDPEAEADIPW